VSEARCAELISAGRLESVGGRIVMLVRSLSGAVVLLHSFYRDNSARFRRRLLGQSTRQPARFASEGRVPA
jgi:hypothetical protein